MRTKTLVATLCVALGAGIFLSGCGADIKSLFQAEEVKSIDAFKTVPGDDGEQSYVLIANNLNDKYCNGTLLKVVALKYGFDNPKYFKAPENSNITCADSLNKDEDHCRVVNINDATGFTEKDIKGNTTCLLSTDTNPNNEAFKKLLYEEE